MKCFPSFSSHFPRWGQLFSRGRTKTAVYSASSHRRWEWPSKPFIWTNHQRQSGKYLINLAPESAGTLICKNQFNQWGQVRLVRVYFVWQDLHETVPRSNWRRRMMNPLEPIWTRPFTSHRDAQLNFQYANNVSKRLGCLWRQEKMRLTQNIVSIKSLSKATFCFTISAKLERQKKRNSIFSTVSGIISKSIFCANAPHPAQFIV